MSSHFLLATMTAASLMASVNASTDPEFYKCTDPEGRVLLTDQRCNPGYTEVAASSEPAHATPEPVLAAADATADATEVSAADLVQEQAIIASTIRVHIAGNRYKAKPLLPALSGDMDTVRLAHLALESDDAASAVRRALRY
jgi:hypothetical protein